MATVDNQQSWLPYESYSRDCSQGFCSIYCPQWCYLLPPPPSLTTDDDDSPTTFSPLVIAIIGVVGSALLLIIYYTLVSKFCDSLSFCRRRRQHQSHHEAAGPGGNGSHHEGWHVSRANGLDEELIKKITVYRYRRGEGIVQGTDCSVCLAEFREDDSIRLLPMCGHAFHLQCIDTWLMSHSSCPLCRCNITAPAAPEPENMSSAATVAAEHEQGVAVSTEDTERIEEEEEEGQVVDVVEIGAEDVEECMGTKDCGLSAGGGSWRSSGEEQSKGGGRSRGMPCVMSPVRMKGSVSGGRSFERQVRESTSLLPV